MTHIFWHIQTSVTTASSYPADCPDVTPQSSMSFDAKFKENLKAVVTRGRLSRGNADDGKLWQIDTSLMANANKPRVLWQTLIVDALLPDALSYCRFSAWVGVHHTEYYMTVKTMNYDIVKNI